MPLSGIACFIPEESTRFLSVIKAGQELLANYGALVTRLMQTEQQASGVDHGSGSRDWFFASLAGPNRDHVDGLTPVEIEIGIA